MKLSFLFFLFSPLLNFISLKIIYLNIIIIVVLSCPAFLPNWKPLPDVVAVSFLYRLCQTENRPFSRCSIINALINWLFIFHLFFSPRFLSFSYLGISKLFAFRLLTTALSSLLLFGLLTYGYNNPFSSERILGSNRIITGFHPFYKSWCPVYNTLS